MNDVYEEFDFTVRSYECCANGKVSVANLCNYLQESASLNAEHLGFNKSNFNAAGLDLTWVLARMRLSFTTLPNWGDRVTVLTYPRNARRLTAQRDFILSVNGAEIGRATTEWMMIDMQTRRLAAIPDLVLAKGNDVRPPALGENAFSKLKWTPSEASTPAETAFSKPNPSEAKATIACRAAFSDIDLNGHVNNTRYIAWIFDALGKNPEGGFDFELAFKNEMRLGEEARVQIAGDYARILGDDGTERVLSRVTFCD